MRLLPLITAGAVLTRGYHFRRQLKVQSAKSATRLPQEPAELDDWLKPFAGADEFRAERQQQLAETASDLEITFLGTASCVPSVTRGVSCTALRYDGATYLFDAGEATQVQAQRTTLVKPGKVEAIFVTHLHGDHTFGLPGLLCLCGQDRDASDQPIEIFGPEGLRAYVRASLQLTQSRVAAPHVIHELVGVPSRPPPGFRARAASKLFFVSRWRVDGVKPGPARVDGVAAAVARSWGIDALTTTKTQARRAARSCRRKRRASRKRPLARSSRGEIFPETPTARGPARRGPRR
jgi:hypothetical protein